MTKKLLLYDTFNAKYLTYREVAESFVSNDEFCQLTGNNSILLMGSRGCGKTTLLKMLTPAGLYYWKGEEADQIKKGLNFTAVYVPSDIQWKNQFDYLNRYLNGKNEFIEVITQFLFASNVQIALCKTFNSVIGFGNYNDNQKLSLEFEVCKSLINEWNIEGEIPPTFDDIELSILKRVMNMNSLIKRMIFRKESDNIEKEMPKYVFDNFFDLIKLGCKVLEQKLNFDERHKWALCFDELEIVPKFIQIELITCLRSVDQKFIFKLTTTPIFNIENSDIEPSQGNDFSSIKLWVYDGAGLIRWRNFCSKLLMKRFKEKYDICSDDFIRIFGEYNLDDIIKEELNSLLAKEKKSLDYNGSFKPGIAKGSSMNYLYKRLAQIDKSFKSFLIKRHINTNDPFTDDPVLQKSVFLKYKVDAIFRLVYKNRTRKKPPIHYGLPYIFDICDGNPRFVIGLIDEILQNSKFNLELTNAINKQEQSQIIFNASEKYYNLINNHPDATINSNSTEINLATNLLDKIGNYIFNKLIKDEFSKNPPSTFRVDEEFANSSNYLKLLETALSLGAIIYLDPIESLSNNGLIGKRFRLSSFLAPKYKIPASRVTSEVRLSTILKLEQNSRIEQNTQTLLFD